MLLLLVALIAACSCSKKPSPPDSEPATPRTAVTPKPTTALSDACRQHISDYHGHTRDGIDDSLRQEVADFQILVERALTYRAESIRLARRLKAEIRRGTPLSGSDLDALNSGMIAFIELRKIIYTVAEAHECWLDGDDSLFERVAISPQSRLKGVMLSVAAALVLYDNYLLAISIYEEDDKLRRFLNERDTGYDIGRAELATVTMSYNSATNRRRVRAALVFYEDRIAGQSPLFLQDDQAAYLDLLIKQSPSYHMTREFSPLFVIGNKLSFLRGITGDTLRNLTSSGVEIFSMVFGNSVGVIESRHGKLYDNRDVLGEVSASLAAGDVLLEKTPFRLTDRFIPGHWGHAAVWIGTEQELRRLAIWDHEVVQRYHEQILQGHAVVEALRSGVHLNKLDQFLNIDDLGVLRNTTLTEPQLADTIIRALRQVGKAYDFNFDIETTDKIVCSELVYVVHTNITWPTENTLGRETISPDHVASKALQPGPLHVTMLYHDGQNIRPPYERFKALISGATAL